MTETVRSTRYPIDRRAQWILAAAFTEFSRRGVRGARMSVIARRARVSLATLRQYFPTTDELFREVIRSTIVRLIPQAPESGTAAGDQSTINRIRTFMRQFWRAMETQDQATLLRLSLSELSEYPELAVFHTTEVIVRAVGRLEGILSEGVRRGEIHLGDIRPVSRVIVSALMMHALWFASPAIYADLTGPDRERAEESVIEILVAVLGGEATPEFSRLHGSRAT
ncbi:MAG TPA: TetR/AcrR family transcriptional regulator [Gemmatimonadales bacterium]|nr:TetR/AcrR family transcriptional regulator [Gemmatimonadales bacterium]